MFLASKIPDTESRGWDILGTVLRLCSGAVTTNSKPGYGYMIPHSYHCKLMSTHKKWGFTVDSVWSHLAFSVELSSFK